MEERKITLAKTAGFCFGVERAVNKVYEQADIKHGPVYTYGPIIHNEEVVRDLEKRGVSVIRSLEDAGSLEKGTVVIRSHGVSEDIYSRLGEAGFTVEDATCPFVLKIHRIVQQYSAEGYEIVIIGNDAHPEVEGVRGWCGRARTTVINSREAAEKYMPQNAKKVCVVSQTTFNYKKFQELVEIIRKKGYIKDIRVLNTICNATEERQNEAKKLAEASDIMIVIGGRSSSNTQKLYEICKEECENTYYIQTVNDLSGLSFGHVDSVGITAGASTPKKIIEEVQEYVRKL